MRQRCTNPNAQGFEHYGGRGIRVCAWWDSFESFLTDMGERPSLKHSLDRIDNDGHYSCGYCEECRANGWPANCRWATAAEQWRNSSRIRLLTLRGRTQCLEDWAAELGISTATLGGRLKRGWSIEQAITTPPAYRGEDRPAAKLTEAQVREIRRRHALGQHGSFVQLAREFGVVDETIRNIIRRKIWKHVE
jgi:hypothetical protein